MRLAEVFDMVVGDGADVEFVAYDGSRSGRPGSDIRIEVRSPRALSALIGAPGQLGVARAYVNGDLDVRGDLFVALDRLAHHRRHLAPAQILAVAKRLAPFATRRVPPPPEEVRLSGRRHAKRRDAAAIAHHYDVSNEFYSWVLGPSMAYTCAVYPKPDSTLEEAQDEKFDLVARKLGLRSGMRLLDVGCGWGGMARHAAKHYGVRVVAVTLSGNQAAWGQRMIAAEGLADLVDFRHGDYRDITETGFDAVASIGLTEHIGRENYDAYFDFLRSKVRPGGRLLNHCITRTDVRQRTRSERGFINRYVFPDGELVHVGHLIDRMEHQRWEVRHEENLREHYAMTLRDWSANLDRHWEEAVADVGLRRARVWRLYLAASRWGFSANLIQLHQVLAVNTASGNADMPLRPDW